MNTPWSKFKKIGGQFYWHHASYFTTVKRAAERQKRMFERDPDLIVRIVRKKIRGGDGITRRVYTLYMRKRMGKELLRRGR